MRSLSTNPRTGFHGENTVAQLKLDVRDCGVACQQNFHGENTVAPLKHHGELVVPVARVSFPRRKCRGPIEAIKRRTTIESALLTIPPAGSSRGSDRGKALI